MKSKILSFALILLNLLTFGQQQSTNLQEQPTIIVLPYTKSGENPLTVFESSDNIKQVIRAVKNALQERGFAPKDLQETIEQLKKDRLANSLIHMPENDEEALYAEARPDIIIKAIIEIGSENGLNRVTVSLEAIEPSSRATLYTLKDLTSPPFKSNDFGYIAKRLLEEDNNTEKFVNGLNRALANIRENGKSITVEIHNGPNSNFKLTDEIGDDYETIKDIISKWIKDNSYKKQFRQGKNSANQLDFDDVKIPLRDENNEPFTVDDFAKKLTIAIAKICSKKAGKKIELPQFIVSEGKIRVTMP